MSKIPAILGDGRARYAAMVVMAGVGMAAGTGLAAFATRKLFSDLHADVPVSLAVLAVLASGGAIVAGMRVVSRTLAEWLGQAFAIALRRTLYRHLAGMASSEVAGRRAGALGLRFVGDLSAARGWISLGLTKLLSAAIVFPGAGIALYALNPTLAVAAALPLALAIVTMLVLAMVLQPLHRGLRRRRAHIAISMMERVAVAPELDLMGRTGKELKALDREGLMMCHEAVKRIRVVSCLRAVPEIGAALAGVALLGVASTAGLPAADAAGALAILGILVLPLRELAGVWDKRCAWLIAREKCEIVLKTPSARRRPCRSSPPAITFDRVHFRHLQIDVVIQPGETVFVAGAPGTGKSSFLALAAGLEVPEAGAVRYGDGERIPKTVFIGPSSPILQGSLRRALTLGASPRPEDEEIIAAAKNVGLGPLLARLGGLDGRVGEAGRTLSSSERWCVHLVRAWLSKPDLLIIDGPETGIASDGVEACRKLLLETDATTIMAVCDDSLAHLADRWLSAIDGRVDVTTSRATSEVSG